MSRRRKSRVEYTDNHERWLISYADFITLLFAFFVVMYAISSVNEGKYRVLSDTLVDAFSTPPKASKPIQIGEPATQLAATDHKTETLGKPQPIITLPKPSRSAEHTSELQSH